MTLSRAVAAATFATGLMATVLVGQTQPANAQYYSDEGDYERPYRSGRRGGYVMEPDPYYGNRGYRRYGGWQDRYGDEDRAYRRRAWRNRDRWADPYEDDPRYGRGRGRGRGDYADERGAGQNDEVRSGGSRPSISAKAPPLVSLRTSYKPGSIIIDQSTRKLYYIVSNSTAYRYPISVGREGFSWTGTEKVSRVADWPDWHPPAEMRERDPKLPVKMTGGINNPLGAKAIYLGNTLYRIHGTNDPKSIGTAASSGCIRMYNGHVVHLSSMAGVGTTVHVVSRLPKTMASN